jgi:hypothetical protein
MKDMKTQGTQGMGSMVTDTTGYGASNFLPASLRTDLDDVKNKMASFDVSAFDNGVRKCHLYCWFVLCPFGNFSLIEMLLVLGYRPQI